LRDYTRLRADLTQERARHYQRLEKLLEDALIKVSSVASKLDGLSVRDMLEALIAGERDPAVLAGLARGKLKAKHGALAEALAGRFDDHHAELARMLLDQIDALGGQIGTLTARIEELLAAIPAAHGVDADGTTGPGAGSGPDAVVLPAVARLDEVSGIGPGTAQVIIAEIGLDMGVFRTPGQLVSWAKLSPRTLQSGATRRAGKTGKGNPYLKGVLGEAAAAAAKTDTFLGERYRRLVKRRGKLKALVAIARSILVIVWHLLADPTARYHDLGAGYYASRIDKDKKARNHIRQLQALGFAVTLTPAA
jgi:transposase